MKKLLTIFTLISILNGSDNYELKLYEKVLPSIFTEIPIKIFVDKNVKKLLKNSDKFEIVNNYNSKVDLLIGKDFSDVENYFQDTPIFSTSYSSFKDTDNSFGAFYWRKGRPQIRFKNNTLNRYNLTLPSGLEKYAK